MQGELFDRTRTVDQLHWGGGTPAFISHDEIRALMDKTREHFNLRDDDSGEYSIEIDPREVRKETMALLREIGFNRMSLGVQDLDERVQKAVNRIQSAEKTFAVLDEAHALGFRSVSVDLIYGLPHQTEESFARTVERVIAAGPDRLSVFNYAHLPERFKPQRRIEIEALPKPAEKLAIFKRTAAQLAAAGYAYIGMDHFARPDDELSVAQRNGTLYRNFQGYSTHADCDLIGLGATSIGVVGNCYAQNRHELAEYYERIDAGQLAVFRGVELDADDILRRDIITHLICNFRLDFPAVEKAHGIDFGESFRPELAALAEMRDDGLLDLTDAAVVVKPAGRLLIRNICMVFDKYLQGTGGQRFSRVI